MGYDDYSWRKVQKTGIFVALFVVWNFCFDLFQLTDFEWLLNSYHEAAPQKLIRYPAREAGKLTAVFHLSLRFSKSNAAFYSLLCSRTPSPLFHLSRPSRIPFLTFLSQLSDCPSPQRHQQNALVTPACEAGRICTQLPLSPILENLSFTFTHGSTLECELLSPSTPFIPSPKDVTDLYLTDSILSLIDWSQSSSITQSHSYQ